MDTLTTAPVETENTNLDNTNETELPSIEGTEQENECKNESDITRETAPQKIGQTARAILRAVGALKIDSSVSIDDITAQTVAQKLKNSFKRIKGFWDDTNRAIRRGEKKMDKLNEQMFELKEERENLENELEGIRNTYLTFCEQAGINAELS